MENILIVVAIMVLIGLFLLKLYFLCDYMELRAKRDNEDAAKEKKYQEHLMRCLAQDVVMEHLKREHDVIKNEGIMANIAGTGASGAGGGGSCFTVSSSLGHWSGGARKSKASGRRRKGKN